MPLALLVLVLAVPLAAAARTGGEAPRVTTDTAEYCASLAARLSRIRPPAPDPARLLAADGMRLCGDGHVRTGVAKLRRAIRIAQPQ